MHIYIHSRKKSSLIVFNEVTHRYLQTDMYSLKTDMTFILA